MKSTNKKKAIVVLPKNSTYFEGLTRAFKYLNIEANSFDPREFTTLEKINNIVFGRHDLAINSLNTRLVGEVKKTRPDFLFVMKAELIKPETIEEINSLNVTTVNWFPDHVNSLDLSFKLSGAYKYFFHFDPLAISQLNKKGRKNIYYLPFAADILPIDKFKSREKVRNLVFIGNYNEMREKYLGAISALGLEVWGDERWQSSTLSKNYKGRLDKAKISDVISSSKIGINIQHEYNSDGVVLRVFEILGSGTLLLTEYKKDLKKLFTINKDLITFTDKDDLFSKAKHYLDFQGEREKIARSGFTRVHKCHTYVDRIKQVLNVIYTE